MKRYCLICALLLVTGACSPGIAPASPAVGPTATGAPTLEPTAAATATSVPIVPVSLARGEQHFAPQRTFQIALGDLDADGDLDAVFANMGSNYSKVWLNDGSGRFEDSGQQLTQEGHGIGMGDLDGDGDLDLFITCASENRLSVIYLNEGGAQGGTSGNFHNTEQDLGDYELSGNAVALHDVDGDGDLDAFVVYYQAPNKIYLNDGAANFTDSGKTFPEDSVLGDLDSDGDVDVFVKELGVGYEALLNDGDGDFVAHWQASDSNVLRGTVALIDLDADGDLDVVIPNGDRNGRHPTRVFMNDGGVQGGAPAQFTDSGQELDVTKSAFVAPVDLDENGYPDLFITNFGLPDQVWLNDGTGHFVSSDLDLGGVTTTRWAAPGDLDDDGDIDIFVADFDSGPNHVWFNETAADLGQD